MTVGGIGKTRRWQVAIALVAALSLFTAVTTGWALRGSTLAQTAGPLPAAWQLTHGGANEAGNADQADGGDKRVHDCGRSRAIHACLVGS